MVLQKLGSTPDELDPFARMFYHEDGFFAGRVQLKEAANEENIAKIAVFREHGVTASGWQLLQAILLPRVKQDFYFLFLPATAVLLAALIIVFRSWKDAAMTAAVLVTVLLLVNAVSVLTDRPWNFLSSLAIPLIVGTGIDYSIHLIFALRRSDGNLAKVWNGVGKAIFFCGLSTVVGFGSLGFASNQTLQSMGILCGAGVFLTMVFSVLVVPGPSEVLARVFDNDLRAEEVVGGVAAGSEGAIPGEVGFFELAIEFLHAGGSGFRGEVIDP